MSMEKREVVEAVVEALTLHGIVDPKKHSKHHKWCEDKIEKEKVHIVRWRKVMDSVTGSIVVAFIIGFLIAIGQTIRHWLHVGG